MLLLLFFTTFKQVVITEEIKGHFKKVKCTNFSSLVHLYLIPSSIHLFSTSVKIRFFLHFKNRSHSSELYNDGIQRQSSIYFAIIDFKKILDTESNRQSIFQDDNRSAKTDQFETKSMFVIERLKNVYKSKLKRYSYMLELFKRAPFRIVSFKLKSSLLKKCELELFFQIYTK